MVRSPCCEKMGLKKGPWTIEEDQILVSHIQRYGHDNWRALPKQAGLLRCGKSCRLRWTNYLRPDIKRGNFTAEEEETIIKLHEMLGNRWSAIAVRLPGRTDNEIKNVWHTHLKKRLDPNKTSCESKPKTRKNNKPMTSNNSDTTSNTTPSPQSSHDFSSSNPDNVSGGPTKEEDLVDFSFVQTFDIDENFWLEALSMDNSDSSKDYSELGFMNADPMEEESFPKVFENDDGMNYFLNLIDDIGGLPEL